MSRTDVEEDERPGVSIVIPTYNYGCYLRAAVESALSQTYSNVEVVVVDDGSTDDTVEVLAPYQGRISYFYQANAGLSAARNTGIARATHPFIVFLDSDDVLVPQMVDATIGCMLGLPAAFALVACKADPIDADGKLIKGKPLPRPPDTEITARDLILINHFSPAVLVRREVFQEVGNFRTDLKSSEDRDMWIRIADRRRVFLLGQPLVLKRSHGTNMSNNASRQSCNMRKVLRSAFSKRVVARSDVFFWLRVAAFYLFQSALMYHECDRRGIALRKMIVSLTIWPFSMHLPTLYLAPFFRVRSLGRILLKR